jgi:acyl-CoA dehydrogenase
MDFSHNAKTQDYITRIRDFLDTHVAPIEQQVYEELAALNPTGDWTKWKVHPAIEPLKEKAKAAGLWNLFLPDAELGQGLTTLEYAPLAEETGR